MADTIIEMSAADYCGKTVQAEMLTYWTLQNPRNFGGYGTYGDAIPANLSPAENWAWWHESTTIEEFGGALIGAYNARQEAAAASHHDFAIVERGASMVRAQIVANFATRRCIEIDELFDRVDWLADEHLAPAPAGTHRFEFSMANDATWAGYNGKFRPHTRSFDAGNKKFTPAQNEFYAKYQQNLAAALEHYREASGDEVIPIVIDKPAVDIQNQLRGHEALAHVQLPKLLEQEPTILGLAGLSESGKGSVADALAADHGFTRFKIGFFNELARNGAAYAHPRDVAMGIVHFIACNRQMQRATLESLHNPRLACEMKMLLGDRWQIAYIEVPQAVRAQRLIDQYPDRTPGMLLAEQAIKDATKSGQDIERHRSFADIVVDNSGKLEDSTKVIMEALNVR